MIDLYNLIGGASKQREEENSPEIHRPGTRLLETKELCKQLISNTL